MLAGILVWDESTTGHTNSLCFCVSSEADAAPVHLGLLNAQDTGLRNSEFN